MSSTHDDRDRTIALAGVFQAARLAHDLARDGRCDASAANHTLDSLFEFEPDSVESVYGGLDGVVQGLRTLLSQISGPGERNLEIARYFIAMVHHGDKLLADKSRLSELGHELEVLQEKSTLFELGDFSRSAQLARLYTEHISPIEPRIMVRGEPLYLQNPKIAEQIRSLLLAGIRAAVLWRQCQGKRWQLLLKQRKISDIARHLLDSIAQEDIT